MFQVIIQKNVISALLLRISDINNGIKMTKFFHALNYRSGAASLTLSWPLMVYTVCVILQGAVLQIL